MFHVLKYISIEDIHISLRLNLNITVKITLFTAPEQMCQTCAPRVGQVIIGMDDSADLTNASQWQKKKVNKTIPIDSSSLVSIQ